MSITRAYENCLDLFDANSSELDKAELDKAELKLKSLNTYFYNQYLIYKSQSIRKGISARKLAFSINSFDE